ncbi:hypothetical protein PtA15_9A603 [Puccinia triticina]|uniref:Uncharacterized protein n=1 Tax=Puccinia triticina TaxID=208348 RepID=A0ABY7CT71_9BASI|nr:uncharacterized protein PtA15_9A603 [Puccinia triticina]WAQ88476.1 hypothetical protein PtA15_9A603 [Puccinia triticina]
MSPFGNPLIRLKIFAPFDPSSSTSPSHIHQPLARRAPTGRDSGPSITHTYEKNLYSASCWIILPEREMGRLLSTSILVVLLGFQSLVQTMRQHNEELFEWSDQMRAIDAANAVEEAAMEAARLEEEARYHAQFPPPPPLPDCPFCERPYTEQNAHSPPLRAGSNVVVASLGTYYDDQCMTIATSNNTSSNVLLLAAVDVNRK